MRKAVVRAADGFVENVVEVEPEANWTPPIDCSLVDAATDGSPGDTWDGKKFVRPEITPVIIPRNLEAEVDLIKADVQAIKIKVGISDVLAE